MLASGYTDCHTGENDYGVRLGGSYAIKMVHFLEDNTKFVVIKDLQSKKLSSIKYMAFLKRLLR